MNQPRPARDERVADAGDVASDGSGQRDDVADRAGRQEELEAEKLDWQRHVEGGVQVGGAMPAAVSAGTQTGIQPPLTTIARPLEAAPTITAMMPGWLRLGHRPAMQQPEGRGVQRQPQSGGELDAVGDGELGADAQGQGEEDQPDPAQADVDETR